MKNLKIIIITGLSGSGKSTAINALEDLGFYCVDNMPVALLPKFLELPIESSIEIAGLAFVMDLREKGFIAKYTSIFEKLRSEGYIFEIVFLEADEKTLQRRYKETRRQHPLSSDGQILDGITKEINLLKDLRKSADKIINTSHHNSHELKSIIIDYAKKSEKMSSMRINILSFGYKYGIPHDADLAIDVRFLPNPFFVPNLKTFTGENEAVKKFVLEQPETKTFISKITDLIDYLIPLYEKEGKAYLTIAIGCTGGMHRSVAVAISLFEHLYSFGNRVILTHRDITQ